MEEKIAIVIPAYKCRFLRQTLDSIVVQTCRSFTVYIGDDASPQNLKEIVSDYADKMNIVYQQVCYILAELFLELKDVAVFHLHRLLVKGESALDILQCPFGMSGIQQILCVGLVIQYLFVVIPCLVIFPCQERTPCNRSPCLMAFVIQVIDFEEAFQRFVIIL